MKLFILENKVNIFVTILLSTAIILYLAKIIAVEKLKRISRKTKNDLDDLIITFLEKIHSIFYLITALYISNQSTNLFLGNIKKTINLTFFIGSTYYITLFIQFFIEYGTQKITKQKAKEDKNFDSGPLYIFKNIAKYSIWLFAVIIILSNLGYNISTIIAGLGIGGIAIAFALQNILSDIFSFISIFFDKPFKIGDFIAFDQNKGRVKHIGIKTTRITTLQGEELIVPNKKLTDSEIHNFRKMKKRRVVFNIGITYETSFKKIIKTKQIIQNILEDIKDVEIERIHFKTLGEYSLLFEIAYYINSQEYIKYLDIQEHINLELIKQLNKEKIEFAYPTKKIFLDKIK